MSASLLSCKSDHVTLHMSIIEMIDWRFPFVYPVLDLIERETVVTVPRFSFGYLIAVLVHKQIAALKSGT